MIRKQIIVTSGKDRHNQQIPKEELLVITQKINEGNASIRLGVEHDPTLFPIGKIVNAKMIPISENENAIEAEIDEFINDFDKMIGPCGDAWYVGESKLDTRPFVQNTHDYKGNILFSINPIYLRIWIWIVVCIYNVYIQYRFGILLYYSIFCNFNYIY